MKKWIASAWVALFLGASQTTWADQYKNFHVAIYAAVGATRQMNDPKWLEASWQRLSSQVKIDKIYIETYRSHQFIDESAIEPIKQFFISKGVQVAGGVAFSAGAADGQFISPSYVDAADRAEVKRASELTARHFDEFILDDFFFTNTKTPADIAAKGSQSWTQFRLDLMDKAAKDLVVGPALAINPKCKVVIKFPNWYEHFAGLGFDLDQEPHIFGGIYAGTETRDPVLTEQHLQAYESYNIIRYFENIKPGGAGGGWVDSYQYETADRYAEQLWDTLFAKAPEITLFSWDLIQQPLVPGDRPWQGERTSFDYFEMMRSFHPLPNVEVPDVARAARYSLEQIDAVLGKLGRPIGIKSYRPPHANGEDFLHNYLGMVGIPIDLYPSFPSDADMVLLTESAKFDAGIVDKIKQQLNDGKSVVITSGLLRALQGKGIEDICEFEYTDHKALVSEFEGPGGRPISAAKLATPILIPEIRFLTNDAWMLVAGMANGNGYPMLLMDRYGKGVLYVLTIPENFNDLYSLPPEVPAAIKRSIMRSFPVRFDGPGQVSLFAYDNDTFVLESFLPARSTVTVYTPEDVKSLRDLVSGQIIPAQPQGPPRRFRRAGPPDRARSSFLVEMPAHSYVAFGEEK